MNNITLSESNKNKKTLTVLTVISVILLIAAVCVSLKAHATLSLVLFTIAALFCIITWGFAMYYSRKITQTKEQRLPVSKLMHSLSIHAVLAICALFAVITRPLVFTVYHAAADGLLAAVIIFTAGAFVCEKYAFYKKVWFAAVIALITALLSGFGVELAVHIILIVLSVIAIIVMARTQKNAGVYKAGGILTALIVTVLTVWHTAVPANAMLHMIMHTLAMATGVLASLGMYMYLQKDYEEYLASLEKPEKLNESHASAASPEKKQEKAAAKKTEKKAPAKHAASSDGLNVNLAVIKAYEDKSFKELLSSPVYALQGVSEEDAKKLKEAFGIDTVKELAELKYAQWAQSIVLLSKLEDKDE